MKGLHFALAGGSLTAFSGQLPRPSITLYTRPSEAYAPHQKSVVPSSSTMSPTINYSITVEYHSFGKLVYL
jgi:hypothetical protein